MEQKDLRSENDNLAKWREDRNKLTLTLLNNAIIELTKLKAIITQKTVSEMMEKLATEEDKEYKANITSSALSKNKIFKLIINEAKIKNKYRKNDEAKISFDGDLQLKNFQLKTIIAKKTAQLKELQAIIERANIKDLEHKISKPSEYNYKIILEEVITHIISDGAYYIKNNQVFYDLDNTIIISRNIFKTLDLGV